MPRDRPRKDRFGLKVKIMRGKGAEPLSRRIINGLDAFAKESKGSSK